MREHRNYLARTRRFATAIVASMAIALLAILMWPGSPELGLTQFWMSWLTWFLVGFAFGVQSIRRMPRILREAVLLLISGLAWWVWELRARAFWLMANDPDPARISDVILRRLAHLLQSSDLVPRFWKENCTHSDLVIVLGMAFTAQILLAGILVGQLARPDRYKPATLAESNDEFTFTID